MIKITCNTCERDLTVTTNSVDYRTALLSEKIPTKSGRETDMMKYPPIKSDSHFCGTACLKDWVMKNC